MIDFDCSIQSCHSGTISHRIWYKSSIFYEISKTLSSSLFPIISATRSDFLQLTSIIFLLAKNQAWNHSFSFKKWHFQFQLNFCRQNSNCFPFKFLAPIMKLIFLSNCVLKKICVCKNPEIKLSAEIQNRNGKMSSWK